MNVSLESLLNDVEKELTGLLDGYQSLEEASSKESVKGTPIQEVKEPIKAEAVPSTEDTAGTVSNVSGNADKVEKQRLSDSNPDYANLVKVGRQEHADFYHGYANAVPKVVHTLEDITASPDEVVEAVSEEDFSIEDMLNPKTVISLLQESVEDEAGNFSAFYPPVEADALCDYMEYKHAFTASDAQRYKESNIRKEKGLGYAKAATQIARSAFTLGYLANALENNKVPDSLSESQQKLVRFLNDSAKVVLKSLTKLDSYITSDEASSGDKSKEGSGSNEVNDKEPSGKATKDFSGFSFDFMNKLP